MNNDEICRFIINYAADERKIGKQYHNKRVARHRSYAIWTCECLYSEIKLNYLIDPRFIIEQFAKRMEKYSVMEGQPQNMNYIFSVACDTAYDILEGIDIYDRTNLGGDNGLFK